LTGIVDEGVRRLFVVTGGQHRLIQAMTLGGTPHEARVARNDDARTPSVAGTTLDDTDWLDIVTPVKRVYRCKYLRIYHCMGAKNIGVQCNRNSFVQGRLRHAVSAFDRLANPEPV
jgi:hypothetical protein